MPSCHIFQGLSPHGRGNRRDRCKRRVIPARAGKPQVRHWLNPARAGKPRVCRRSPYGSIPARAGKPWTRHSPTNAIWVYPRTGGETWQLIHAGDLGLSPHGRGNLMQRVLRLELQRSIPARAGKPRTAHAINAVPRVYPRTGGETVCQAPRASVAKGLSPHGRGNLHVADGGREISGSIPARAGKPFSPYRPCLTRRVYPRTGGETRTARRYRRTQ